MTMSENKRVEAEYAYCYGEEAAVKYMDFPRWEADIPRDSLCMDHVTKMLADMVENDTMPNEHLSRENWEEYYFEGFMRKITETRDVLFWEEEKRVMHSE